MPISRIKLLSDNVLLQPVAKNTVSPGGIIFKPSADFFDKDRHWIVAAVGPGRVVKNKRTKVETLVPMELVPGDMVLVDVDSTGGARTRLLDGRIIVRESQVTLKW
jgi:co-chaperonin GroES (HSP10)